MAIMVLLCLWCCVAPWAWLLRSQVCAGQLCWSSQGLIVLAGVDGAALRAFFKPSLGALLSLLPDRRFSSCTTVVGRDKDRATRATDCAVGSTKTRRNL